MTMAPRFDELDGEETVQPVKAGPRFGDIDGDVSDDPGLFRSLALAIAQGGTKRWADEIGGAVGRLTIPPPVQLGAAAQPSVDDTTGVRELKARALQGEAEQPSVSQLVRDKMRAEYAAAQAHHPLLTGSAEMGADIAGDVAATLTGAKAAGLAYQLGSGAASGAGASDAGSAPGVLLDAGLGTAGSLAGYGGAKLVSSAAAPTARYLKGALKDFGARRAIKATGAIQSDIKGIPQERLLQMGRQLHEQGVITPLASRATVLQRSMEGLERTGSAIGGILEQADEAALKTGKGGFDWAPVMSRVNTEVRAKLGATGRRAAGSSIKSETGGYAPSFFDDIAQEAADGGGYSAANRLKAEIADSINWTGDSKLKQRVAKQVVGILNDEIEKQTEKKLGGQIAQEFGDAKSLYGTFKLAKKGSTKGLERETGNRFFGLAENAIGAAEIASGAGLPIALAKQLGSKALREHGSSALSSAAFKAANSDLLKTLMRRPDTVKALLQQGAAPVSSEVRSGYEGYRNSEELERTQRLLEALRRGRTP